MTTSALCHPLPDITRCQNPFLAGAAKPKCPECGIYTLFGSERVCIECTMAPRTPTTAKAAAAPSASNALDRFVSPEPPSKKARTEEPVVSETAETASSDAAETANSVAAETAKSDAAEAADSDAADSDAADSDAADSDTTETADYAESACSPHVREDCPHPDDAPPDEAIGQQREDEPPVAVMGETLTEEPCTSVPATPRSDAGSVARSAAGSVYTDIFAPDHGTLMARAELSIMKKVSTNHMAFARLIALELKGMNYAVEKVDKENLVVQWFDQRQRTWVRGGGARNLHDVATETLYRLFQHLPEENKSTFGCKPFISPVVDLLKNYLLRDGTADMPPLDGDQTRGLVHFSCGNVLDLRTGRLRPCEAEDRISLCTGYPFVEWDASDEDKAFVKDICDELNELWRQHTGTWDVTESLPDWENRLNHLRDVSKVYNFFYCLFEDHSMATFFMRVLTCACGGLSMYEFMLFLVDPRGTNGKGTILALLKALLGDMAGGYYGQLDYTKHFVNSGVSRACLNSPDIAALVGKRVVAVNESPAEGATGGVFNTTLAKSLSSGDEPLPAMAKYKDPMTFKPQCKLIFCTNTHPEFPPNDGGFKSRVSYVNMPFEWVQNPTEPGQRKMDPSVKEHLVKTMQGEFWFWACQLTPGLMNPKSRLVTPQPEKVLNDSNIQFMAGSLGTAEPKLSPNEIGELFVKDHLVSWNRSWGTTISSRGEVDRAFLEWCPLNKHRARPHEAFRGILEGPATKTRVTIDGNKIQVYWRPEPLPTGVNTMDYLTLKHTAPPEALPQ